MPQPTHMFLERTFAEPLTVDSVLAGSRRTAWCFELHNVVWHGSYLAADGCKILCYFTAADAESTRMALQKAKADHRVLWSGTIHEEAAGPAGTAANVLVERRFDAPVELAQIQSAEDSNAWCLETHRVKFACAFFSSDRKRMLCLYQAPDAEAVRAAQREAGMPFESVWAFQWIDPKLL